MTGTFKQRKVELVAEGFDPRKVTDPLYFDDRDSGAYVRVGDALVAGISSGAVRL